MRQRRFIGQGLNWCFSADADFCGQAVVTLAREVSGIATILISDGTRLFQDPNSEEGLREARFLGGRRSAVCGQHTAGGATYRVAGCPLWSLALASAGRSTTALCPTVLTSNGLQREVGSAIPLSRGLPIPCGPSSHGFISSGPSGTTAARSPNNGYRPTVLRSA